MLTFLPTSDIVLTFITIVAALVIVEVYVARRREKRILSEANSSVLQARTHSDAQIQESRRRVDEYQARIVGLMEEHNALLREIVGELKAGGQR